MFVVAFKSYSTRAAWYRNEAEIAVAIHERSIRTKSGTDPFRYFDGPTMVWYQVPSRAMETVFCRRTPTPGNCLGCRRLISDHANVPLSAMEVKHSGLGENSGRGVFAKADIPKGAYVAAETSVELLCFMPSTLKLIDGLEMEIIGYALEGVDYYVYGYGYSSRRFVSFFTISSAFHVCYANATAVFCPVVHRESQKCLWTQVSSLL